MGTVKRMILVIAATLAIPLVFAACGDTNTNPTPPTFTTGSSGSSGEGGQGGQAGAGGGGSGGTAGAGGAANCDGANGCYACPPTATEQYLNACTGAQCSPFDNVARWPLYNGGKLPPLP